MRKKVFAILALLLIVVGIIVYRYESLDYIKTIDYSLLKEYADYETANRELLVKELVSEDGAVIYDYYKDFVVIYLKQSNGNIRLSRMQFYTDAYSFGYKKITVGTSKTKIQRLLHNSKKCGTSDRYMCDDNGQLLEILTDEYVDKELYEYGLAVAYNENDTASFISIWNGGLN